MKVITIRENFIAPTFKNQYEKVGKYSAELLFKLKTRSRKGFDIFQFFDAALKVFTSGLRHLEIFDSSYHIIKVFHLISFSI